MKDYDVNKGMDLYFEMKDNQHRLNESNKMLVANIENAMALLPVDSDIKKNIDFRLEERDKTIHTDINNTLDLPMIRERQLPVEHSRAGFINGAILLYGIINVGIIVALALMK